MAGVVGVPAAGGDVGTLPLPPVPALPLPWFVFELGGGVGVALGLGVAEAPVEEPPLPVFVPSLPCGGVDEGVGVGVGAVDVEGDGVGVGEVCGFADCVGFTELFGESEGCCVVPPLPFLTGLLLDSGFGVDEGLGVGVVFG